MLPLVQDLAPPNANTLSRRDLADATRPGGQSPSSGVGFRQELDQKDSSSSMGDKGRKAPAPKRSVNDAGQTDHVGAGQSERPSQNAVAEHPKAGVEKDHPANAKPLLLEPNVSRDSMDLVDGASLSVAPILPIDAIISQASGTSAAGPSDEAGGGMSAKGVFPNFLSSNGGGIVGDVVNGALPPAAVTDAGPEGSAPKATSLTGQTAGTGVTEAMVAVPKVAPIAGSPQPPSQGGTGPAVADAPTRYDEARRAPGEGRDVPVSARAVAQTSAVASVPQAATPQPLSGDPLQDVARQNRDSAGSGALSMLDPNDVTDHRRFLHDGAMGGPAAAHPSPVSAGPPQLSGLAAGSALGLSRQIVAAVTRSLDGAVDLTLSPEELGRVRLSLSPTDAGGIIVQVSADRAETMEMIRRHIDILAQDFRAIGYGSVAFGFSDSRSGSDGRHDAPATSPDSIPAAAAVPEIVLTPNGSTGLDLRL